MKARLPMLFAVAALVLLIALVAWGNSGIPATPPAPPATADTTKGKPDIGGGTVIRFDTDTNDSSLLLILLVVLGLVVAALLSVLVTGFRLRRLRRVRVAAQAGGESGWLSDVTRNAMSVMDRHEGGPPSDAVIAAWVHLEESAAASGTERRPHQTPSEFTEAVLSEYNADAVALQELKAVYHRARFGEPGQVTTGDVAVARAALQRIALEAK